MHDEWANGLEDADRQHWQDLHEEMLGQELEAYNAWKARCKARRKIDMLDKGDPDMHTREYFGRIRFRPSLHLRIGGIAIDSNSKVHKTDYGKVRSFMPMAKDKAVAFLKESKLSVRIASASFDEVMAGSGALMC